MNKGGTGGSPWDVILANPRSIGNDPSLDRTPVGPVSGIYARPFLSPKSDDKQPKGPASSGKGGSMGSIQ